VIDNTKRQSQILNDKKFNTSISRLCISLQMKVTGITEDLNPKKITSICNNIYLQESLKWHIEKPLDQSINSTN